MLASQPYSAGQIMSQKDFGLNRQAKIDNLNKSNCFHFHLHNEYAFITYGQQMLETSNLMLALF